MDRSHVILKRWPRSDLIRPYLSSQQQVQLVAFCLKQGEQAVEDAKAYVESRWGDLYRLIRVVGTVSCDSEKDKYLVQRNFKEVRGDDIVVFLRLLQISTCCHKRLVILLQRLQCPLLATPSYRPWLYQLITPNLTPKATMSP